MKNKKFLINGSILFIFISLTSCYKKSDDYQQRDYFPMKVGNSWTYEITDSNAFSPTSTIRYNKITIIKDTVLANNQEAFIVKTAMGNNIYYELWYLDNNDFMRGWRNTTYTERLYKNPMAVGQTWMDRDTLGSELKVTNSFPSFKVVNENTLAYAIESGDPIVKDGNSTGYYKESIYAPGIGLVGFTEIQNFYGFGISKWKLTGYYVN